MRRLPGSGRAGSGQCGCRQSNVLRCELAAQACINATPPGPLLPGPTLLHRHLVIATSHASPARPIRPGCVHHLTRSKLLVDAPLLHPCSTSAPRRPRSDRSHFSRESKVLQSLVRKRTAAVSRRHRQVGYSQLEFLIAHDSGSVAAVTATHQLQGTDQVLLEARHGRR